MADKELTSLLASIEGAPDTKHANAAVARARTEYFGPGSSGGGMLLPDELDEPQLQIARAMARRDDLHEVVPGVPGTGRLRRRWLGIDPPSVLERSDAWTHEGREVEWPRWKIFLEESPDDAIQRLSHAEMIEAVAEDALEPYGLQLYCNPLHAESLDHAEEALDWARKFVAEIVPLRAGGLMARERGYSGAVWEYVGITALRPLVAAGVPIDPSMDCLLPYSDRVVLAAVPDERREAFLYHRASTDWSILEVINGLDGIMATIDLAPSLRIAEIAVLKLRNPKNKGWLKTKGPRYRAELEKLAKTAPGVAEALKPRKAAAQPKAKAKAKAK